MKEFWTVEVVGVSVPSGGASYELNAIISAVFGPNLDLQHVNLVGYSLLGANLAGDNLQFANFQGDNLQGANLVGANLQHSDFQYTVLSGADFASANMQHVDFTGATLMDFLPHN